MTNIKIEYKEEGKKSYQKIYLAYLYKCRSYSGTDLFSVNDKKI